MAIVNMSLVTEVQPMLRRDFELARTSLLNPDSTPGTAASPIHLLDGEFLMLDANYRLARGGAENAVTGGVASGNPGTANHGSVVPSFPFWLERGRTDMQAINKGTVLFGPGFEADFHSDVLASGDSFAVGDPLYVDWLSNGSDRNRRRGLTKVKSATALLHGYVTRVFTAGNTFAMRALVILP